MASCRREAAGPPADSTSVVLITLDTTRADRLGCYGHAAARTPVLDELARRGVRFERAYTHAPLTLPAHTSLLTGIHPPAHGLRINGGGVLGAEVPTLAESFAARGYQTAAFVGAWVLDSAFGLDRGFGHYDDEVGSGRQTWGPEAERPGDQVCDAALAWLESHAGQPFFVWIHLFDPHHPYSPPSDYQSGDPYDGEISFVDAQIGRILGWLETKKLRDRALIVVAGDHGESFTEHGEPQHGLLVYGTTMHVPLLMSGPARFPAGRVVPEVVRLVDVAPTIMDAMGWEPWPELEGKSLLPAWRQQASPQLAAYGESYYGRLSFGWAPLRCLTTQRWKYIAAPGAELYDLAADPGEEHNVVQAHPDVAAQLAGALSEMVRTFRPRQTDQVQLDGAARQRLVALGYVGGATAADSDEDAKRRDPKDMLDVLRGLMNARSLAHDGRYQEIVGLLEPLVAASPESDALHGLLGQAYLELGRLDEAQRAYEASLRTVSDDPVNLCGLGDVLSGRGKPQDAVLCYRRALEVCPSYSQAHSRLGLLYAQQGDFKLAEQHYREDLELRPRSPNALSNLANVVLGQRRAAEAAALLRQALELDPGYVPAHQSYWRALLWSGATAPAVAALRQALGVMPGNADLKRELAWLLATARDSGVRNGPEALRWARECCSGEAASAADLHVLAAAHAANGQFVEAAKDARRALAQCSDPQLSAQIAAHLAQFEAGRPIQGGF